MEPTLEVHVLPHKQQKCGASFLCRSSNGAVQSISPFAPLSKTDAVQRELLRQLDYPARLALAAEKLATLRIVLETTFSSPKDRAVVGFLARHYTPRLPYHLLCIAETARSQDVGQMLEDHAVAAVRRRGCDRIELHCHPAVSKRTFTIGGAVTPRYLMKQPEQTDRP